MSGFSQMVLKRQSCRSFDADKPIEREKLEELMNTVSMAPSACNSQPWHFTVVTEPELLVKTADCLNLNGGNSFTKACRAFIVITEEKAFYGDAVIRRYPEQHFARYDIGIAVAHICYAAQEQGLSTCVIGYMDEVKLSDTLNVPAESKIALVIAMGYAKNDKIRTKKRRPLTDTVTWR